MGTLVLLDLMGGVACCCGACTWSKAALCAPSVPICGVSSGRRLATGSRIRAGLGLTALLQSSTATG